MNFKKTIVVEDPPYKFVKYDKQKRKNVTYYLTGNLFFNRNVWTVHNIIVECKRWLLPHVDCIPPLSKMQVHIVFERNNTQWDLDNKGYYWEKIFFDVMKTPSVTQLQNAHRRGKDIVSANVLFDDTVKYVDDIRKTFVKGGNRITFHITGTLIDEQKELF